ncbi:MAG: hypothetical protein K6A62_04970 [Bacteroidales bacterium]|nr:hypothetical protein [Bacteroidales bacterium]
MQPVRNSHIIRHTLRNYLAAAIFAGIIIQLNCTILLMGATLLIAPAFGNQDYGRVNRMLTVGLASALLVSGIFTALLAVFAGPVSLFITQDARLQPMLQDYLPFAFVGGFFGLFACAGSQFVQISGRPRLVASLFGADAALAQLSAGPLRIFSGVFLPATVLMTQANAFLLAKRGRLAGLLQAGIVICTLPLALALSRWNLWFALPLGMLLPMLGGLVAAALISKREGKLHPVWLIPGGDAQHAFAVSVGYSRESVSQQFSLLCERLEEMHLPQAENTAVSHCVEEMMLHQSEMGQSCRLKGSFDVGIVDVDDRFTILVKAAGKAFNPLHAYGKNDPEALSLRIVKGFCRDVNYRYASGVNCVYLNFDKPSDRRTAAAERRGR